jgi:transcriptional regulator with XRE-family HTH domain
MSWKSWIYSRGISLNEFADAINERYPKPSAHYHGAYRSYAVYHCVKLGFNIRDIAKAFGIRESAVSTLTRKVVSDKMKRYATVAESMKEYLSMNLNTPMECKTALEEIIAPYITQSRYRESTLKRQIIMHYLRNQHQMTLREIAELFNRNHATVIHAEKLISNMLSIKDKLVLKYVDDLRLVFENVKKNLTQHCVTD